MTNALCFTKDRPLQLDCYLESFYRFCKFDFKMHVLYFPSNEDYQKGYDKLMEKYPDVVFINEKEKDFKTAVREVLTTKYFIFGCDDVIFIDDFHEFDLADDVFSFGYRLGENLTHSHTSGMNFKYNDGYDENGYMNWQWRKNKSSFAYPFEVGGSLIRAEDIIMILDEMDKKNYDWGHPNKLESGFYINNLQGLIRPRMMSYKKSVAYVLTINRVQDVCENNIYDENSMSTEECLELFNEGKKIDIDFYKDKTYNSIHIGEFEIK